MHRARTHCAKIPRAKVPRVEIYCAGRPAIAPPAPHHQATDLAQPAKKLPNRPNLSGPILSQQLVGPGSPKTRSANLGFEIRGLSRPPPPPLPQKTPLSQIRQTRIPNEPNSHRQRQRTRPRHRSPAPAPPPKNPTQSNLPNRCTKQTQFPKTNPDPHLTATCPGPHQGSPHGCGNRKPP